MSSNTPPQEKSQEEVVFIGGDNDENNKQQQTQTQQQRSASETIDPILNPQRIVDEFTTLQNITRQSNILKARANALKDNFTIWYAKPTGRTIRDPFGDQEEEIVPGTRTLTRNDNITQGQYQKYQMMAAQAQDLINEGKTVESNKMFFKRYQYMAWLYFGMQPNELKYVKWDEFRSILDGCEMRTANGLPYTPSDSRAISSLNQALQ